MSRRPRKRESSGSEPLVSVATARLVARIDDAMKAMQTLRDDPFRLQVTDAPARDQCIKRGNPAGNVHCLDGLGDRMDADLGKIVEDCSHVIGADARAVLRDPDVPVGMMNFGATCYLNSSLQALFHIPVVRNFILSFPAEGAMHGEEARGRDPVFAALRRVFVWLAVGSRRAIAPREFVRAAAIGQHVQQDAGEFFLWFVHELTARRPGTGSVPTAPFPQFLSRQHYIMKCLACGAENAGPSEDVSSWTIPIKGHKSLEDAMAATMAHGEAVDDVKCTACGQNATAMRKLRLSSTPNILVVILSRLVLDMEMMQRVRLNDAISCPEHLNVASLGVDFSDEVDKSRCDYSLQSIILHKGQSAYRGHFTAEVKDPVSGRWFAFDDETVKPLGETPATGDEPPNKRARSRSYAGPEVAGDGAGATAGHDSGTEATKESDGEEEEGEDDDDDDGDFVPEEKTPRKRKSKATKSTARKQASGIEKWVASKSPTRKRNRGSTRKTKANSRTSKRSRGGKKPICQQRSGSTEAFVLVFTRSSVEQSPVHPAEAVARAAATLPLLQSEIDSVHAEKAVLEANAAVHGARKEALRKALEERVAVTKEHWPADFREAGATRSRRGAAKKRGVLGCRESAWVPTLHIQRWLRGVETGKERGERAVRIAGGNTTELDKVFAAEEEALATHAAVDAVEKAVETAEKKLGNDERKSASPAKEEVSAVLDLCDDDDEIEKDNETSEGALDKSLLAETDDVARFAVDKPVAIYCGRPDWTGCAVEGSASSGPLLSPWFIGRVKRIPRGLYAASLPVEGGSPQPRLVTDADVDATHVAAFGSRMEHIEQKLRLAQTLLAGLSIPKNRFVELSRSDAMRASSTLSGISEDDWKNALETGGDPDKVRSGTLMAELSAETAPAFVDQLTADCGVYVCDEWFKTTKRALETYTKGMLASLETLQKTANVEAMLGPPPQSESSPMDMPAVIDMPTIGNPLGELRCSHGGLNLTWGRTVSNARAISVPTFRVLRSTFAEMPAFPVAATFTCMACEEQNAANEEVVRELRAVKANERRTLARLLNRKHGNPVDFSGWLTYGKYPLFHRSMVQSWRTWVVASGKDQSERPPHLSLDLFLAPPRPSGTGVPQPVTEKESELVHVESDSDDVAVVATSDAKVEASTPRTRAKSRTSQGEPLAHSHPSGAAPPHPIDGVAFQPPVHLVNFLQRASEKCIPVDDADGDENNPVMVEILTDEEGQLFSQAFGIVPQVVLIVTTLDAAIQGIPSWAPGRDAVLTLVHSGELNLESEEHIRLLFVVGIIVHSSAHRSVACFYPWMNSAAVSAAAERRRKQRIDFLDVPLQIRKSTQPPTSEHSTSRSGRRRNATSRTRSAPETLILSHFHTVRQLYCRAYQLFGDVVDPSQAIAVFAGRKKLVQFSATLREAGIDAETKLTLVSRARDPPPGFVRVADLLSGDRPEVDEGGLGFAATSIAALPPKLDGSTPCGTTAGIPSPGDGESSLADNAVVESAAVDGPSTKPPEAVVQSPEGAQSTVLTSRAAATVEAFGYKLTCSVLKEDEVQRQTLRAVESSELDARLQRAVSALFGSNQVVAVVLNSDKDRSFVLFRGVWYRESHTT